MKIRIQDIKITRRIRKENGDITSLKKSLRKHGLLNPIIVTPKNELLTGYRRLSAARELGWTEIEATVFNAKNRIEELEIEMEENLVRQDFTNDELLEGLKRKRQLASPNIFVRFWNFLKRIFGVK